MAKTIWQNPHGVRIPDTFLGYTAVGAAQTYTPGEYALELADYPRMGHFRWYGVVNANMTHPTPGTRDWAPWDRVADALRKSGVSEWQLPLFNLPPWLASRPIDGGQWQGCLPKSSAALAAFLDEITGRYPEFVRIEVANEVTTGNWPNVTIGDARDLIDPSRPELGAPRTFWKGTGDELAMLTSWLLDWRDQRNKAGASIRIVAPSIPGFDGNLDAFFGWVQRHISLVNRCDEMSLHLYYARGFAAVDEASQANGWVCWPGFRHRMAKTGVRADMPVGDGEHGFSGDVAPADLINTAIAEAVSGVHRLTYFSTSQKLNHDAYLGIHSPDSDARSQPHVDALFSAAVLLNGQTVVRVIDPEDGTPWQVAYAGADSTQPPKPDATLEQRVRLLEQTLPAIQRKLTTLDDHYSEWTGMQDREMQRLSDQSAAAANLISALDRRMSTVDDGLRSLLQMVRDLDARIGAVPSSTADQIQQLEAAVLQLDATVKALPVSFDGIRHAINAALTGRQVAVSHIGTIA